MNIIPLTAAYLDQMEELETICFSDPWPRQLLAEVLALENAVNLAAEGPDGALLGYISFQTVLDEGSINNLAVRPEARRQGVASALLEEVQRQSRAWGLTVLWLEVRASNQAAWSLYRKFGFVEIGRRRDYYDQPKEDALCMKWDLV